MSFSAAVHPAVSRDSFLDAVRTWAILRVVAVHMLALAPTTLLFWPAPTFVMPGMPLVFFVSGALALRSLDDRHRRKGAMTARQFYGDRFRRLLVPFWVYVGFATAFALVLDRVYDEGVFDVDPVRATLSFIPLLNPINSPAAYDGVVHLWFLVAMSWLLLAAPLLARLYRRFPRSLFSGSIVVALAVPYVHLETSTRVWAEINAIALFQFFFILGFAYTNGLLTGVRKGRNGRSTALFSSPWAFVVAFLSFAAAWLVWQWEQPPFVNASALVHGLLGLGWLSLILRGQRLITALAHAWHRPLTFLNRRALTIYLYGWPATALGALFITTVGWGGNWGTTVFIAVTVAMIAVAVKVFGPLEDWAARRPITRHDHRQTDPNSDVAATA
jgi:peptidoglycan/LPS O-acetylase OafA/YrhL